ncbi:MAG TPA: Type 1 glutamine amidotransferase-like domain-containing protein [Candidatus Baltobacteraceae bacterium]|nr:Type 1 glutamine amidotransferase-like domain-containing protein [Candidatus Baltobacteraceae bacterium]
MRGPIVLIGSGEFMPAMEAIDRELLAATGHRQPRVAIVPTAAAPAGEAAFLRLAEQGRQHFRALGAEVEAVPLRTRADADDVACAQAIGEADLIHLCGGDPAFLYDAVAGTAVERALGAALDRGAIVAGCGAGAMVLADRQARLVRGRPVPGGWLPALGFVPRVAVLPGYDALPEALLLAVVLMPPWSGVVVGIDRQTTLIGRDGSWQVLGHGRVTIWRGRRRTRYRDGETMRI